MNDAYYPCSAVAETTTGCLFATENECEYKYIHESDVTGAAHKLLYTVSSSTCVDEYLQDQVSFIIAKGKFLESAHQQIHNAVSK